MRILTLHTYYPTPSRPEIIGGAEVSASLLSEGLASRYGHEVTVVRGLPPLQSEMTESTGAITVHSLPLARPYWLYDGQRRSHAEKAYWHFLDDLGQAPNAFEKIIAETRPDVALSHNIQGLGWATLSALKRWRVPIIQTLHDYYLTCPHITRFRGEKSCRRTCTTCRIFTRTKKQVTESIDCVVGVSKATLDLHLAEGLFKTARFKEVIGNAVEVCTANTVRSWPETRFGFIGRIAPEKGLDVLVRAFKSLRPDTKLYVAGRVKEDDRVRLLKLAERPVEFLGFVDPKELFEKIDVLVVPSLWSEPFGRISIEAQAFGVPCIVSDRGGLPDTIKFGESGWTFEPDAEGSLFRIMKMLVENKQRICSKAAQTHSVASSFSIAAYLTRYNDLLHELVASR